MGTLFFHKPEYGTSSFIQTLVFALCFAAARSNGPFEAMTVICFVASDDSLNRPLYKLFLHNDGLNCVSKRNSGVKLDMIHPL